MNSLSPTSLVTCSRYGTSRGLQSEEHVLFDPLDSGYNKYMVCVLEACVMAPQTACWEMDFHLNQDVGLEGPLVSDTKFDVYCMRGSCGPICGRCI